jgi:outer membrane lipoprotein
MHSILIVGTALLLQGCPYAISPDITRSADRTITFEKLQADPLSSKGKTVILGGLIAQTRDLKTGTLIEVVQKEIDYWGRPRRTDRTGGRFIVLQPRHLDAMVFVPGREITIAGEVTGDEEVSLSGPTGAYVLINAREIKLWPREKPGWDKAQFLDPLYDPSTPQGKYGY